MSEKSQDRELTATESALRELRPKADEMDRAALMYRVGRASARGWLWPLATSISTTAALALGIALWIRPAPPIVYVSVPSTRGTMLSVAPPPPPVANDPAGGAWSDYVHLQEQVLLHGLDGLPESPNGAEEPSPDAKSLLNSL